MNNERNARIIQLYIELDQKCPQNYSAPWQLVIMHLSYKKKQHTAVYEFKHN